MIWRQAVPDGGGTSAVALVSRRIALHSLGWDRPSDRSCICRLQNSRETAQRQPNNAVNDPQRFVARYASNNSLSHGCSVAWAAGYAQEMQLDASR